MITDFAVSQLSSSAFAGAPPDALSAAQSPEAALAKPRNEAIDVVRLLAAAGIVYVHAVRSPVLEGSRNLFRFAVPFYLFASFYFQSLSLRRKTDKTLGQYVGGRVKRLYLPFLAWSVVYLVARDIRRIYGLHIGPVRLQPGLLWKGIEYHLWFLPFLLAGSILLAIIHWSTLRHDRRWRWPLIVCAVAAGFAFAYGRLPSSWDQTFDNPTYAYVQGWRAMPAMCWALAFAWFMTMGPVVHPVSCATGAAGIALAVVCSLKQALQNEIQLVPRALSGLGSILAALAPWKGALIPTLARFGRYSYGIYLCHVLIAEFVRELASHSHLHGSAGLDMLIFISTLLGSFVVVAALGSSRRTAWLNG